MRSTKGSITIEATIALTAFLIFLLTILSFGRYYKIEQAVKHCVNQTAVSMSFDNRARKLYSKSTVSESVKQIVKAFDSAFDTNVIDSFKETTPYTELWKTQAQNNNLYKPQIIPNVIGMDYISAYNLLRSKNLMTSFVTDSSKIERGLAIEGEVIKQSPIAGLTTEEGSTIVITVATTKKDFNYHPHDSDDEGREYVKRKIASLFTYYMTGKEIQPDTTDFYNVINSELKRKGILNPNFDNSQLNGANLTVRIDYKIVTGFSFHSLFGSSDIPFTDSYTIKLQ